MAKTATAAAKSDTGSAAPEGTETAGPVVTKKEPKPGELKALFSVFEAKEQAVKAAEAALAKASEERSAAVAAIGEFGSGPYNWKGRLLTVTRRKNEETGKTTVFFKSTGDQVVIAVN